MSIDNTQVFTLASQVTDRHRIRPPRADACNNPVLGNVSSHCCRSAPDLAVSRPFSFPNPESNRPTETHGSSMDTAANDICLYRLASSTASNQWSPT